ncbi:MAG: hypothetical protein IKN47_02840 [Lachnospiraceae bacterium]|nr:hypothetical protein [Lachnospiraceae bacterium]
MYIALADSSVGDRKQMERLLERESDKRVNTTGVFYIETYGSREALLNSPTVYDAYFLDVTDKDSNSYDIAKAIRDKGIKSPVVFCISTIDYHNCGELLENSVFINKPIKVAELSLVLDQIIKQKKDSRIPTIEFRDNNETFYLSEKDIMYMQGEDYSIRIIMPDSKTRTANGFIDNIWNNLVSFDCFFPINNKTIVNAAYIKEMSGMNVLMTDGTRLKVNVLHKAKISSMYEEYKKKHVN